jgi:hypothetical protein
MAVVAATRIPAAMPAFLVMDLLTVYVSFGWAGLG